MARLNREQRILNLIEWLEWVEDPVAQKMRSAYTGPHPITCGDACVFEHGETVYCCKPPNHPNNHRSPDGIRWWEDR